MNQMEIHALCVCLCERLVIHFCAYTTTIWLNVFFFRLSSASSIDNLLFFLLKENYYYYGMHSVQLYATMNNIIYIISLNRRTRRTYKCTLISFHLQRKKHNVDCKTFPIIVL